MRCSHALYISMPRVATSGRRHPHQSQHLATVQSVWLPALQVAHHASRLCATTLHHLRLPCARQVFSRAFKGLREGAPDAKEEALLVLEEWRRHEEAQGWRPEDERAEAVEAVAKKMPKKVKRRRPVRDDTGAEVRGPLYLRTSVPAPAAASGLTTAVPANGCTSCSVVLPSAPPMMYPMLLYNCDVVLMYR